MDSTIFEPLHSNLHVPSSRLEKIIEMISFILLLGLVAVVVTIYPQLPAKIPSHFTVNGEIDGWAEKQVLWAFTGIVGALYLGLTWLARMPHRLNYPGNVTQENAPYQYALGRTMLRTIKLEIVLMSAAIAGELISIAQGGEVHYGVYIAPVFLAAMLATALFFAYRSTKIK